MGISLRQLSRQKLKSYLPRILTCTSLEAGDPFSMMNFKGLKKDAIFVDRMDKAWRMIGWHVDKFEAIRNRDAEQVKLAFKADSQAVRRLFRMLYVGAGGYSSGKVIVRNCSLLILSLLSTFV